MSAGKTHPLQSSQGAEVTEFLRQVAAIPKTGTGAGRLVFALDATASRQPTWDQACRIQGEMFHAVQGLGGLRLQLCYYRGLGEFEISPWLADPETLLQHMIRVQCLGGATQIERLLRHVHQETRRQRVDALVFVGDCVEEAPGPLCALAGELGLLRVPIFLFQEGHDPRVGEIFARLAALSGGAHCRFDGDSAAQLRDLLRAVAVYAVGGRAALEDFGRRQGGEVLRLTQQLRRG